MQRALRGLDTDTRLLAGSLRRPAQLLQLAQAGVSHFTMAPAVWRLFFEDDVTQAAVANFQRLSVLVTDISEASQEQSGGIEQVTHAVGQMDEVTQQNAALVEESAAAAQSLKDRSVRLSEVVATFRLSTTDSAHAAPRLSPPGG